MSAPLNLATVERWARGWYAVSTMRIHGQNLIGGAFRTSSAGASTFTALKAATGERLEPSFVEAGAADVEAAASLASAAFADYRNRPARERAAFLDAIAREIEALGEPLLETAAAETGLGLERLRGERGRTIGQLRLFARLIEEGSWVDGGSTRPSRIESPRPSRTFAA